MLTQNYYNFLANILETAGGRTSGTYTGLSIIGTNNEFFTNTAAFTSSAFPVAVESAPTLNSTAGGISVGTGNTPPTLYDTNLEETITEGISMVLTESNYGVFNGVPYVEYIITVTNISSSPVTIKEIGYKQKHNFNSAIHYWLVDRTVLENPITIQAGDAGIIDYRLQTITSERYKSGIKLVPFTYGTNEEIAAMIDAARNGLIDLHTDGGWRVGDFRNISVGAWTGGGNVSHSAQQMQIVISQFGDYNECGSIMQFDFQYGPSVGQRFGSTSTSLVYKTSEMYLTSLPAMVEALPEWLKSRLKTFNVVAASNNSATEFETVENNKLALRSFAEVFRSGTYYHSEEGPTVELYRYGGNIAYKYPSTWLRTRAQSNYNYMCTIYNGRTYSNQDYPTSTTVSICPFGCI